MASALPVKSAAVLVDKARREAVNAFQGRMTPDQFHVTRYIIISAQSPSGVTEIYGSVFVAGPSLYLYVVNLERDIQDRLGLARVAPGQSGGFAGGMP
jgi:hypothetical protein